MSDADPTALHIPPSQLADLAVEHWRLSRWLAAAPPGPALAPARYAARRLGALLSGWGAEAVDLTGRPFDPGLAVEVIDALPTADGGPRGAGDGAAAAAVVVVETVVPIVLWRGAVVRAGQVVTGPPPSVEQGEERQ